VAEIRLIMIEQVGLAAEAANPFDRAHLVGDDVSLGTLDLLLRRRLLLQLDHDLIDHRTDLIDGMPAGRGDGDLEPAAQPVAAVAGAHSGREVPLEVQRLVVTLRTRAAEHVRTADAGGLLALRQAHAY